MSEKILEVKNLEVSFGIHKILNKVNFSINKNKTLALIGESGSGKSVCVKSILKLDSEATVDGEVTFNNTNLLSLSEQEITKIRGKKIAMVFQNPLSGLNPVLPIGKQITEVIQFHQQLDNGNAINVAIELLHKMKVTEVEKRMKEYPHQQSGGINQRIMIAIALSCKPEILIADEPTSSLDTINQKSVIEILKALKTQSQLSMIFVTHNINLAKEIADEIAIMKQGKIIEFNTTTKIFSSPQDEYTSLLIKSSI